MSVVQRRPVTTACVFLALATSCWFVVALRSYDRAGIALPLDFQVYRDAAISMLHGQATYAHSFTHVRLHYTYPPFALLLMSVLALWPAPLALALWSFCSALALIGFVSIAIDALIKLPRCLNVTCALSVSGAACLFLQPVRSSLEFGQINFLLMLAIIVDLLVVKSSSRGVLTGIAAAIKLTPLIYIAYFALSRARSSVARALITFVAAAGIAWLVLPADSVTFWLHQAFSPGRKGKTVGSMNQSWFGLAGRIFPHSHESTVALWLLLSLATVAVGVFVARHYLQRSRNIEALLALALCEVLISPISWAHHWSWIILLPLLLVAVSPRSYWVSAMMAVTLAVSILAPYRRHLRHWRGHEPLSLMWGFSLLLSGVALLITMALAVRGQQAKERKAGDAPYDGALSDSHAAHP
jgi:alpha-1,2-mannosyltransferase